MGMFFLLLLNSGLETYCIAERQSILSPSLRERMSSHFAKQEKWYKPDFLTFHSIEHNCQL